MAIRKRSILLPTLVIIVSLITLRAILPYGVQWYVNRTLAQAKSYAGHVGDIDLSLWRGAYQMKNVKIMKSEGALVLPFFSAERVEFSLLWSALIHASVVGEATLWRPEINFIDSDSEENKQTGASENWLNIADDLFPLRIDRLSIKQGKIAFHNEDANPAIHIAMRNIDLDAYNLANSNKLSNDLTASVVAKGNTMNRGDIVLAATANPESPKPTFDLNIEAKDVAVADYEDFLNHYAPFDLEAGTLEFAMELACDNGKAEGYIKPVFNNVEVFSWDGDIKEDGDGLFASLIELFAGALAEIFENQSRDQVATNIPIKGSIDDLSSDGLKVFWGLVRNAFVEATEAKLDNSISLEKKE